MKKEYLRVISEYLGIYPVRINSNLVSAQNRDRWYWTNIKTIETGLFSELWTGIPQPKDEEILLKDILQIEDEIDSKYYLSEKMHIHLFNNWRFKPVEKDSKSRALETSCSRASSNFIKLDKQLNKKNDQNKSGCLTAGGHSGGNHSDMDIICVAMRGRNPENSSDSTIGTPTTQRLEPKTDGKTNCLTSVAKDNLLLIKEATVKGYTEIEPGQCVDLENLKSKTRRGRKMEFKSNCVMTGKTQFHKYTKNYKLRRLTPTECSRLQTIPSWYKWIVSDTQIYRMLGNGWTVEVIKHIFKTIPKI